MSNSALVAGYWLFTAAVLFTVATLAHFVGAEREAPIRDIYAVYDSPLWGFLALADLWAIYIQAQGGAAATRAALKHGASYEVASLGSAVASIAAEQAIKQSSPTRVVEEQQQQSSSGATGEQQSSSSTKEDKENPSFSEASFEAKHGFELHAGHRLSARVTGRR